MLPNRLLRARRLFIRNVTITAPIGAYEHEKKAPQRLILSCDVPTFWLIEKIFLCYR